MSKYAIMVSSSRDYLPYLNALLNSIEKRRLADRCERLDVYVFCSEECPQAYLEAISSSFSFRVLNVPMALSDAGMDEDWGRVSRAKAGRYYYLKKYGAEYDVSCLMDADLFVVSGNFMNLFDLVNGTDKLIGCNERFKWQVAKHLYTLNGEPLFPRRLRIDKFHCNTPLILNTDRWEGVIDEYLKIVYRGKDYGGNREKPIGDIFAWNFAVYQCGREDEVILFPMEAMTQVHQTGYSFWTHLEEAGGFWTTYSGEEVFTVHARPNRAGFKRRNFDKGRKQDSLFGQYARLVCDEWNDLNFAQKVRLSDYGDYTPIAHASG